MASNKLFAGVRRALWIATTPLALTFLLAQPAQAQHQGHDDHDHGAQNPSAEHIAASAGEGHGELHPEAGHHGPPKNPVVNFWSPSYRGKDSHGGPYEPEKGDHKMPAPFLGMLFNFAVVAFLVGKFGGPAIRKIITDRHEGVAKQLEESTRLREEAKAKLDEYSRKVSQLDAEIAKLVDGIRSEAEHDKQRILAEATARAERMKKEAEQTIAAEIGRVRLQLEREATLSAIAAAEKLLAEKTTEADHRKLNEQFIGALSNARTPRA